MAVALVDLSFAPVLAVGALFFRLAVIVEAGFFDALCALCCATAAVPALVVVFLPVIVAMIPFARVVRA
jgi:hypothetical protein